MISSEKASKIKKEGKSSWVLSLQERCRVRIEYKVIRKTCTSCEGATFMVACKHFESFTPLDALKLNFRRILNEQNICSQYQHIDKNCASVIKT